MTGKGERSSRYGGLWLRLTAAFLVVALVGVGLVALLANRVTAAGVRYTMIQGQLTDATEVAAQLAEYYRQEGDWSGASEILGQEHGQGRGGGRGPGGSAGQLYLAEADGRIVAGVSSSELGRLLDADILADGLPIEVEGQVVGTLVVSNAWTGALGQVEEEFLGQVNRALIFGGIGAVAVALALGTLLAWRITTPVRRLTQAAERLAAGDLSSRVAEAAGDEIGRLAVTFNQMAANLDRADELRRRMTADVAHELRTPLSIIRGQVEAIQDGIFPPDAEHLAPIHDEVLLLNRLVEDLRTLALAEAGQLRLHKADVDLGGQVRRLGDRFGPMAADRSVALEVEAPSGLAGLLDADRIDQVLNNLLANALRHTPAGGRVTVTVATGSAGELLVEVSDSGPGIRPEELPHVFDRFWRGEGARAGDRGGAGLGLAIARQLVEAHGGRIWVESELDAGTSVKFTLPR
jgi:two-component system OmpR family sensor kinase